MAVTSITLIKWDQESMTAVFTINDELDYRQITVPAENNTSSAAITYLVEQAKIIWKQEDVLKKDVIDKNPDLSDYINTIIDVT